MTHSSIEATTPLHELILNKIDALLTKAEQENQPLELEPTRGQLFELFVTAHGAGFLQEGVEPDLTADILCKQLAEQWGLDQAAQTSVANQQKMDPYDVSRMRVLWSLLRMWMEWTYAWDRWDEFHPQSEV